VARADSAPRFHAQSTATDYGGGADTLIVHPPRAAVGAPAACRRWMMDHQMSWQSRRIRDGLPPHASGTPKCWRVMAPRCAYGPDGNPSQSSSLEAYVTQRDDRPYLCRVRIGRRRRYPTHHHGHVLALPHLRAHLDAPRGTPVKPV
jgi:hypothetical protein